MASDDGCHWPRSRPSPVAGDAGAGGPGLLRRQPVGGGGRRRDRDRLDPVTSGRSVHRRPAVRRRPGFRRGAGQAAGGDAAAAGVRAVGRPRWKPSGCSIPARRPPTWSVRRPAAWPCWAARPPRRPRWRPTAGESGSSSPRRCGPGRRRIVVGLGGSACTDGGQGMIAELGGLEAAREQLADVELIAASDTEYPLLGPWGAARVFGPQKGADTADRRRARSPPRGVGARTRGGGRRGTSAPSRARAPPAVSAPGCSRSAADASPARKSSPNTPTWPTTSRPRT